MKNLCLLFCFLINYSISMFGQGATNRNLQEMLNTERAFSKLAGDKNTKIAFLTYLADNSVMFSAGKVVDGKKLYENRQENQSLLFWEPSFGDIAASGDFGYDFGPWEYKIKRTDEKPAYYGHFISIWTKKSDGKWKLTLDVGVSHVKPEKKNNDVAYSSKFLTKVLNSNDSKNELFKLEQNLITELNQKNLTNYFSLISNEAHFFREGMLPMESTDAITSMIKNQYESQKITYSFIDGDIATSGDLAYVYGNVTIELKNGQEIKLIQANYQRFWKKEDGKNWVIVLDNINQ